jgi:type 1 glutamine amidotransferase
MGHSKMNRRELLRTGSLAAAGLMLSPLIRSALGADVSSAPRKKVLFFTKSAGFQHGPIKRSGEDPTKLSYAEQILTDLGAATGFDVTCSKDGRVFAPNSIGQFDLFAFYTTGDLTTDSDKFATKKGPDGKDVPDQTKLLWKEPGMPPGAKEAFLDAIAQGKGFVGFHSATDTFHSPHHTRGSIEILRNIDEKGADAFDPYIKMIGGEFIVHGKQQESALIPVDPNFPGAVAFKGQRFTEEWYALKNFSRDLHVILAQDCTGMSGDMYQRASFPETWARMHGKGRVFYTSLGHREDVWKKPEFIALTIAALNWVSGRIDADVTPNLKTATPDAETVMAAVKKG